jgi:hypothetical protein
MHRTYAATWYVRSQLSEISEFIDSDSSRFSLAAATSVLFYQLAIQRRGALTRQIMRSVPSGGPGGIKGVNFAFPA